MTVSEIAKAQGVSVAKFVEHNPQFHAANDVVPAEAPVKISVTVDKPVVAAAFAAPKTLAQVAENFGVSERELLRANPQIESSNKVLSAGTEIVVPKRETDMTVSEIAKAQGVSVAKFVEHNPQFHAANDVVPAQAPVKISVTVDKPVVAAAVAAPKTLAQVAENFGVSERELLRANPQIESSNKVLSAGTEIVVPKRETDMTVSEIAKAQGVSVAKFVEHNPQFHAANDVVPAQAPVKISVTVDKPVVAAAVAAPKTLAQVAENFGVSERELLRANPQIESSNKVLSAGTEIVVPKRETDMTVSEIAKAQGVSVAKFVEHNPQFHAANDVVPAQAPVKISVTVDKPVVAAAVAAPKTLAQVAENFGVSERELLRANPQIESSNKVLSAGTEIVVPKRETDMTVSEIAKAQGVSVAKFVEHNPQFHAANDVVPAEAPVKISVTVDKPVVAAAFAAPKTLAQVAENFGVSERELLRANPQIESSNKVLSAGTEIVVPKRETDMTVSEIAKAQGVSVAKFVEHNPQFHAANDVVPAQAPVKISVTVDKPVVAAAVAAPKTLAQVAENFGVSERELLRANPQIESSNKVLSAGTEIVVPKRETDMTVSEIAKAQGVSVAKFVEHNPQFHAANDVVPAQAPVKISVTVDKPVVAAAVAAPKTLAQVAENFGVSERELLRANPQIESSNKVLSAGTEIVVPKRETDMTVSEIAKAQGVSVAKFVEHNPQFHAANDVVPAQAPVKISVTVDKPVVAAAVAAPKTLAQVAENFGVSERELLRANPQIESSNKVLSAGTEIVVPKRETDMTVSEIAKAQGVSVAKFVEHNPQFHAANDVVPAQAPVKISVTVDKPVVAAAVAAPKTLAQVAENFGVAERELLRANPQIESSNKVLSAGTEIVVPKRETDMTVSEIAKAQGVSVAKFVEHTPQFHAANDVVPAEAPVKISVTVDKPVVAAAVAAPKTLAQVAENFGVSERELLRANPQIDSSNKVLSAGTEIVVPKRETDMTVSEIAKAQGVSVATFVEHNPQFHAANDVVPAEAPVKISVTVDKPFVAAAVAAPKTLAQVAENFGVSE